jgi:peptide/nickel transport system substrate-binding protein
MKKFVCLGFLVSIYLWLPTQFDLFAGGNQEARTSGTAPVSGPLTPKRGGTLRVRATGAMININPVKFRSRAGDRFRFCPVYESLLYKNEKSEIEPWLAESYEVKDDLTIAFKLREDVYFHDGTKLNAEAAKFVLDYYRDPETKANFGNELEEIASIDITGPYSFVIKLSRPSALIVSAMSNFDGMMISPKFIKEGDLTKDMCGTGPFMFEAASYVNGEAYNYIRNPRYYLKGADGQALPYLDRIEFRLQGDDMITVSNMLSGEIDLTELLQNAATLKMLETQKDKVTVYKSSSADTFGIFFNTKIAPFDNKKVRQAISYGINKQEVLNSVALGMGTIHSWIALPTQYWYKDDTNDYPYDLERAKRLLAEAGYPNGFECIVHATQNGMNPALQEAVILQLNRMGIKTTARSVDSVTNNQFTAEWSTETGKTIICAKLTMPRIDPFTSLFTNHGKGSQTNYSKYDGEEYVKLMYDIKATYDQNKRKELLWRVKDIMTEDVPSHLFYHFPNCVAYRNTVHGVIVDDEGTWHLQETWKE